MKKIAKLLIALMTLALVVSAVAVIAGATSAPTPDTYTLGGEQVQGTVSAVIGGTTYVAADPNGDGCCESYVLTDSSTNTLGTTPYYYAIGTTVYTDTASFKSNFESSANNSEIKLIADIQIGNAVSVTAGKSRYLDLNGFDYKAISSNNSQDPKYFSAFTLNGTRSAPSYFYVYSSRTGGKLYVSAYGGASPYASAKAAFDASNSSHVILGTVTVGGVTHDGDNLSVYTNSLVRSNYNYYKYGIQTPSCISINGGYYYSTHSGEAAMLTLLDNQYDGDVSHIKVDITNAKFYLANGKALLYTGADGSVLNNKKDYVINITDSVISGEADTALFSDVKNSLTTVNIGGSYILVDTGDVFSGMNINSGCRMLANPVLNNGIISVKNNERKTFTFYPNEFFYQSSTINPSSFVPTEHTKTYSFTTITSDEQSYTDVIWMDLDGVSIEEKWFNGTTPVPPSSMLEAIQAKNNDLCAYSFGNITEANGGSVTYTARGTLRFNMKINMSLSEYFVYNVYVPKSVDLISVENKLGTTSVELTGSDVEIDETEYTRYSFNITAANSTCEYFLMLELPNTVGGSVPAGEDATFIYTMQLSIPQYAYQVLNADYGATTNELMYSTLMYAKCASDYFPEEAERKHYNRVVTMLEGRTLAAVAGTAPAEISDTMREFLGGFQVGYGSQPGYRFVFNEAYTSLTSPAPTISYRKLGASTDTVYTVTAADVAAGGAQISLKAADTLTALTVTYGSESYSYSLANHIYSVNNKTGYTQEYKNLLYSLYAYASASASYLTSNNETPTVDVKINNNSINGYTVYAPEAQSAANKFINVINSEYGENTIALSNQLTDKQIRFVKAATDSDFDCRITVDGNNLIIECAYDSFFDTAALTFGIEYFTGLNTSINLAAGFEKEYYYGKIMYSDFGVVGNGTTDDFSAIKAAHDAANAKGYPVYAEAGKTYYIKNTGGESIIIKTDTDWRGATFIIDDTDILANSAITSSSLVLNANDKLEIDTPIFTVENDYEYTEIRLPELEDSLNANKTDGLAINSETITSLETGLGYKAMLRIINWNEKHFIRFGVNGDVGQAQMEIIVVDENGNIDESTPFLYDFAEVTHIYAYRIDANPITVGNASFETKACLTNFGTKAQYINGRNIVITRPNTTIKDITHTVDESLICASVGTNTAELMTRASYSSSANPNSGASYGGFFAIKQTANVTLENCNPTKRLNCVSGTYDITVNNSNNIILRDCDETNFFKAGSTVEPNYNTHWGVINTNFCKNISYIDCELSRFDAHCGVYNVNIIRGKIFEIRLAGGGTFYMEDTEVYRRGTLGAPFIELREDYGSSWKGDIVLKGIKYNYAWNPGASASDTLQIIKADWAYHSFGGANYKTYLPNVVIDGIEMGQNAGTIKNIVIYRFRNISTVEAAKSETKFNSPTLSCGQNLNVYNPAEYVRIENYNGEFTYTLTNDDSVYAGSGNFLEGTEFSLFAPWVPEDPDRATALKESPIIQYPFG